MPFKRKIPGLPLACNERSQTASGSHLVCVDLLPLLNSHKSSGKLVLERSERGKSCLRQDVTLFAEGTKFAALPHENLPLSASSISIPAIPFWSLLLGRCFAHQL